MDVHKLADIAKAHQVATLEVFGSAARRETEVSDYDFLVRFNTRDPLEHGRLYFSLLRALQDYLNADVDLLELDAIRNPYFLTEIEADRTLIYAA